MTAPDKIWTDDKTMPGDPARNGYWENRPVLAWDEYTRSDLIPAMLAEARAEGRREALREAVSHKWLCFHKCDREEDVVSVSDIIALLDAEAPAQPKPDAVQKAANDEIERLRDALSEIAAPPAYAMDSEDRVEALRDHARNALKIGASNDLR